MEYSGAWGKLIHEKNLKSKFRGIVSLSGREGSSKFVNTLLDGTNVRLNWNIESDLNVYWIKFKNFLSLYWFKNKQYWI